MARGCTKDEKIRRIRAVQEYLLQGYNGIDITMTIMTKWNIGDRMARKYIQKARESLVEINEQSIKERFAWHVAARERLINKNEKCNPKLVLETLKDLAALEGQYNASGASDVKTEESCEMVLPGGMILKI